MIHGGPGLGKSAVAAALVNQGIKAGSGEGRAAVAASYFFKFDDSE
jgi:hypothetical protein